jgi:hypothetical protein
MERKHCPPPENMKALTWNQAKRAHDHGEVTPREWSAYQCAWARMSPRFSLTFTPACPHCGAPSIDWES